MLLVVVVGAGLLLAGAGSSVLVSGLAVLLVVVVGAGLLLMMPLCSADGADDAFVLGTALGTMLGSADGAAVPCALGCIVCIATVMHRVRFDAAFIGCSVIHECCCVIHAVSFIRDTAQACHLHRNPAVSRRAGPTRATRADLVHS